MKTLKGVVIGSLLGVAALFSGNAMAYYGYGGYYGNSVYGCNGLHTTCAVRPYYHYVRPVCNTCNTCNTCGSGFLGLF
jgi:hypothetical protein